MKERKLVQKFERQFKKDYPGNYIKIGKSNNQSSQADIELEYNSEYIKLEAKVFNDTRNNSGNYCKIFGQVLFNRCLEASHNNKKLPIKYGFLFHEKNIFKIKSYINKCNSNDLIAYGKIFEVEYVFIYDDNTSKFWVEKWNNFIK